MTEPTVHRVAVTVFALVEGADALDASHVAEIALRQNLSGCAAGPPEPLPVTIHARLARGPAPVTVVQVMETGMAAGNGYLWTEPTSKAFREGGDLEPTTMDRWREHIRSLGWTAPPADPKDSGG